MIRLFTQYATRNTQHALRRQSAERGWQDAQLAAIFCDGAAGYVEPAVAQNLDDLLVGKRLLFVRDQLVNHIFDRERGGEEMAERHDLLARHLYILVRGRPADRRFVNTNRGRDLGAGERG